jgi:CubicO group peptidase (beta-lactamase class C family)
MRGWKSLGLKACAATVQSGLATLAFVAVLAVVPAAQERPPGPEPGATIWMASAAEAERLARIETSLPAVPIATGPPIALDLEGWLRTFNVPGLSVAVFDDFRVVWAKTYGVKEVGKPDRVTVDTLFQAGSISKPVAAIAALHHVERGMLSLDADINAKLVSWKVPENEFTRTEKVTLRRLLSHSAGLTVHGFPGYAVTDPVPTLVQVLDGVKPANTAPVRVDVVPGSTFRYSGGGTTVVQLALVDQLGKPFPQIMSETVFTKLGLANSTYEQPLPPGRAAFELNVELYPEDANAYDSLGEGYMAAGRNELAIANYRKSLSLDPKNENAVAMLKKLGVEWKP